LIVFQRCSLRERCDITVLKLAQTGLEEAGSGTFEKVEDFGSRFLYVPSPAKRDFGAPQPFSQIDPSTLRVEGVIPRPERISKSGRTFLTEQMDYNTPFKVSSHLKLCRLDANGQPILVRGMQERPWDLTDDLIVSRRKNFVVIETIEGSQVSSFPIQKGDQAYLILDEKRLLRIEEKTVSVVDLNGKQIRQLPLYPYTRNLTFSRDGNRVLLQSLERTRNGAQLLWDALILIPTLTVFESRVTAKATRVVDTQTGGICMEEVYQGKDF
jgi:hypothetical protein